MKYLDNGGSYNSGNYGYMMIWWRRMYFWIEKILFCWSKLKEFIIYSWVTGRIRKDNLGIFLFYNVFNKLRIII